MELTFRNLPIRKLYLEAIDFNNDEFASGLARGLFREEARLRAHKYFDGVYRDLVVGAVYADTWERVTCPLESPALPVGVHVSDAPPT